MPCTEIFSSGRDISLPSKLQVNNLGTNCKLVKLVFCLFGDLTAWRAVSHSFECAGLFVLPLAVPMSFRCVLQYQMSGAITDVTNSELLIKLL